MTRSRKYKSEVERCRTALQFGYASALATGFAELECAERHGIVDTGWRQELPVDEIREVIQRSHSEICRRWQQSYEQLKRILDYGGSLIFEEMVLVLSLRDELELTRTYVSDPTEKLGAIDILLRSGLHENREVQRECMRLPTRGLAARLSSHWWWGNQADGCVSPIGRLE